MTSKDIQSELEKQPFIPFRIHMVSGNTIDVTMASEGWLLQNAILVFKYPREATMGYNVIALRTLNESSNFSCFEFVEFLKGVSAC